MSVEKTVIKSTCPRDCYDACGLSVIVRDGIVQKVLADKEHHVSQGGLCGKCALAYNGIYLDPTKRLSSPLRRVGRKGAGEFEAVSWDVALHDISERLKDILATREARSIYHTHYTGTVSMIAGWFPLRFFNRLGATEVDPDTVCNKAGHVVLADMFGTSLTGFDPDQLQHAKTLLIWGANPSHSAPHMHMRWVRRTNAKVIVVDPIAHDTAKIAALHLQPRPGTDAALAFGLLHVLKSENLIDRAFIERYVVGFDELDREIEQATPDRTAKLTGVPAELIRETALQFGSGPSMLWLGQGVQRQPMGGNVFRSLALLSVAAGHIGKPGAGFCYMNGPETRGVDMGFLMGSELRADDGATVSHIDLADHLADAAKVSALFTWNNNIAASSPNQLKVRQSLQREDLFTVVTDIFMTDTALFADYVLPAASFLEFDDIVFPYFHNTVSAQGKAVAPFGQSLPNQEIFRRLAAAMGYTEPSLFECDQSLIDKLLSQTRFGRPFEDLKAMGTAKLYDTPLVQFENLTFATPSTRIEVASERLASEGHPRVPFAHADAPPKTGWLRVISPSSEWLMNSSYGNDDRIRQRIGEPKVFLSPEDARGYALENGAQVTLRTSAGQLTLEVSVSESVPAGVALVHKGHWPRHAGGAANVNILNPGLRTDIAESTAVHGVEAELIRL
ncbi:molybdopterin-containing oxidoreductase family protein [Hyphomicrobium sp.]|uniref:molybdopterin-containing oxidoreductase family protein n=1 Tax=Hyphomicrobium sp. TaxID=82 RepID=UPI002E3229B8|nr:molybdopterin-dependent oxidoreductase [Hyphomicrobium sp.]HEX2843591.1 molybdopterin-dependent oxidoreductase [Hyphomicrobium sp.]